MAGGDRPDSSLDIVDQSHKVNDDLINGPGVASPPGWHKDNLKRLIAVLVFLLVSSLLLSLIYFAFFRQAPSNNRQTVEPKPDVSYVNITSDKDLSDLKYGVDYSVALSGKNYLVNVSKTPKRVVYNGAEVYRGEDVVKASLSGDGSHWAIETSRDEIRSKVDENTKITQKTNVKVSTFIVNGQKWGEKDGANLVAVTNSGKPVFISSTGKQTPSQYGESLSEEVVYFGSEEKFRTGYGVISFVLSFDDSTWLATTKSPNTKELIDLFVNNSKKASLDGRLLKTLAINSSGDYLSTYCQSGDDTGRGLVGSNCEISVNGKTRTTISGSMFIASTFAVDQTYAGVDNSLGQIFLKNNRTDLSSSQKGDIIGVYLNNDGNKYAIISSFKDGARVKLAITINNELVEDTASLDSLFKFGVNSDSPTLFVYNLPK